MVIAKQILDDLRTAYGERKEGVEADYREFLSIPTISADPAYKEDVLRGCAWVENFLAESGLTTEVWETPVYPAAYGEWLEAGEDKPTLLIYGHYDVQPVDPLEEWDSPPFEPTERDGEIYARGAQDNKGQLIYALHAIRYLVKNGGLAINLKVLIEGEEESKSVGLEQILEERKSQLKADYLLAPDFDVPSLKQPSVTLGLRGMVALGVKLRGSNTDMHSGMHGGVVYNPLHALVEILAQLRDEHGRVTVPGFYDDVKPLTELERGKLSLEFDEEAYEEKFEAAMNGGEKGFTAGERNKARPTLEINGISGGYAGPMIKTVIPAVAEAKISCRLVSDQDAEQILASIKRYLRKLCPEGMELEIEGYGAEPAVRGDAESRLVKAVAQGYTDVFGAECQLGLSGGSVPITAKLSKAAGATPCFMGLGLMGDQIHAPNEHFGLNRIELGFLVMTRILQILGE